MPNPDCDCPDCSDARPQSAEAYVDILRQAFIYRREPHNFIEGQLVTWRPGRRYAQFPDYGQPAVVVEYIKAKESNDAGSLVVTENIRLGVLRPDGSYAVYPYESWRFQPYEIPLVEKAKPKHEAKRVSPLH